MPALEFTIENALRSEGYSHICGIDEAGRGPLFGPVAAAACILPADEPIPGLDDSKKLTARARDRLFDVIRDVAVSYGIAFATVEEIERYNILEAALLAMRRAVDSMSQKPDFLIVDGNIFRGFDLPGRCVVHGDAISPSIAAASVLAKVSRDRICIELDEKYPGYGIAKHKGYGTREHLDAIRRLGPTPEHRLSFLHLDHGGEGRK